MPAIKGKGTNFKERGFEMLKLLGINLDDTPKGLSVSQMQPIKVGGLPYFSTVIFSTASILTLIDLVTPSVSFQGQNTVSLLNFLQDKIRFIQRQTQIKILSGM